MNAALQTNAVKPANASRPAKVSRDLRNLANLGETASTSRVLNLSQIYLSFGDARIPRPAFFPGFTPQQGDHH